MERNILKNRKGVALIIALLLLLALTLIGISSINTTTIETGISGNDREKVDAFYTAEAGVQVGIHQIPVTSPIPTTKLKENSYYWSGTADDRENPKAFKSFGIHQMPGFDSSWAFRRYQINVTGESFRSTREIEVQVSYGPFRADTDYN
ncbi:MAG: hypothetical protein HXY46_03535 [Syntrophaceae bacterium]|nr:hypothetical protein [Syntrophaceae bacterium]